jgi:hypothetical protein
MYLSSAAKKGTYRREPSGKLQRPNAQQRRDLARIKNMVEIDGVCMQPHRRGADDPSHKWLECALGRYCLAHSLHHALFSAGQDYAALIRRWRAAKGVPTEDRIGVGGSGVGPSPRTVAKWEAEIEAIEQMLMRMDNLHGHFMAVRRLCVDDVDLFVTFAPFATAGLLALANHMGRGLGRHPFAAQP